MSFSRINDKSGDKTKTFIISSGMDKLDKKINQINKELNNKIVNINKKLNGLEDSKIFDIVKTNKNNIGLCVLERQKNDRDIDTINAILKSNKEMINQLLKRCEYLEENLMNVERHKREENNKKELERLKKVDETIEEEEEEKEPNIKMIIEEESIVEEEK